MTDPLLDVRDLRVLLPGKDGTPLPAVDGLSFQVGSGEIVGIAGESGSGKTMTALALFGLLPYGASTEGSILFDGNDVLPMSPKQLRDLRGKDMSMVFQDPMTALHPMLTVELQITEHLRYHTGINKKAARARALELLEQVRIPDPIRTLHAHPHQFSGGMRQRIAIAVALGLLAETDHRRRTDDRTRCDGAGRHPAVAGPATAGGGRRDRRDHP